MVRVVAEQEWLSEVTSSSVIPHGRPSAYTYHGCRCDVCRNWKRSSAAEYRQKDRVRFNEQRRAEYARNPQRVKDTNRKSLLRRYAILDRYKVFLGCLVCGFRSHPAALQFHHRVPSEKSFTISMNVRLSWPLVKLEVRKCDVLCANCHSIQHASTRLGTRYV